MKRFGNNTKFAKLALAVSSAFTALCVTSPAHASVDPQYQCKRNGVVEAIVIPSSFDKTKAKIQFAGQLATIPAIELVAEPGGGIAERTYVNQDQPGTRFDMLPDFGKLFFGDFFANCYRVPESEEDADRMSAALPMIEVDARGLTLIQVGLPESRIALGHDKEGVLAFVSRYLGSPSQRFQSEECATAPEVITFTPLSLHFAEDRWVGWTLNKDERDINQSVYAATAEGLRIGTLDTSRLSEAERVTDSTLGSEYVSEGVSYVLSEDGQAVAATWAGDLCVYR